DRWPPLQAPLAFAPACLLVLRPDGNSGKPKAEVEAVPEARRVPAAARRAAVPGIAVPAAAPEHPVRGPFFVQILAPLPHVAVHVVQPQLVRRIRTHLGRTAQVRTLLALAEWIVTVEIGLCGREVVGRFLEVEVVRTFFFRSGPTSTS